ncbi:cupin domain-containing protein [Lactiplantibacillus mudanjiangensis]|uniref:Pectin degradation protein [Lactobacillus zymae] n=1 Tax=Lactiplantibacillus mudanjiangensis TaxID=1296538 RepID=A0A660E2C6_9LACO|nr:cupin domain-containing protein [Lactiplantibacillus mudanjiangensis]VDG22525.1 Putative pectin degradation protein [Lactobacillus zymae] [Lactiplantibacillus mudanjiangensis]VDG26927.1 Putative pectin degradation protein [Lactobacillus zymae] [Lactiplantibacillus mudanjiangensis]
MFFKNESTEMGRVDDNTLRKVTAYGDGLMNAYIVFEKGLAPDSTIPFHHHVHVQTTYVLKGSFKFAIKYDDHTDIQEVHAGDGIYFPSDHEHGCIPLEDDSRLLDSFTPIREDFL